VREINALALGELIIRQTGIMSLDELVYGIMTWQFQSTDKTKLGELSIELIFAPPCQQNNILNNFQGKYWHIEKAIISS